jgi:hypothetical protein
MAHYDVSALGQVAQADLAFMNPPFNKFWGFLIMIELFSVSQYVVV